MEQHAARLDLAYKSGKLAAGDIEDGTKRLRESDEGGDACEGGHDRRIPWSGDSGVSGGSGDGHGVGVRLSGTGTAAIVDEEDNDYDSRPSALRGSLRI